LEPISRRYQVDLAIIPPQTATSLRLPEPELKQVLFNLIRNAIQASAPGQKVSIHVTNLPEDELAWEATADSLIVQVIDRGTGIADDILPHIFEPFFTTKGQLREGLGLGLSVSRNLVESFGGKIDVTTAVGIGTTFTVTLPQALAEAPQ
jgi:signal transduction histidine kinase